MSQRAHGLVLERSWADKTRELERRLARHASLAVAFSGGVDSSVLLHSARAALGPRAVAVIADSPSLPRQELEEARSLAAQLGVTLHEVRTQELADDRYRANLGDRCFYCKSALFEAMTHVAERDGIRALAFGEITDDLLDDRPGARAARAYSVHAPLREAGFSKSDVRRYAREQGLPVADKPAAACLASRIPVGTEVTPGRLRDVEEAEAALRALGIDGVLRVRHLGARARVEVEPAELEASRERWPAILGALSACGFEGAELGSYGTRGEPPR